MRREAIPFCERWVADIAAHISPPEDGADDRGLVIKVLCESPFPLESLFIFLMLTASERWIGLQKFLVEL